MLSVLLDTGSSESVMVVLIESVNGWQQVVFSLREVRLFRLCKCQSLVEGHWLQFAPKQLDCSASFSASERVWMRLRA